MFELDVKGHEGIKNYFEKAASSNAFSHSYIFEGNVGVGKKLMVKKISQYLLCENPQGHEPCGKCKSCILFSAGNHPDFIVVSKEDSSAIKIEAIKEKVIRHASLKPYGKNRKIIVIQDAETLSNVCQNALLKTIEEPPSFLTIFLVTTTKNVFLDTIISRCCCLDFAPLADELVFEFLKDNIHSLKKEIENTKSESDEPKKKGKNKKEIVQEDLFALSVQEDEPINELTENDILEIKSCVSFCNGSIGKAISLYKNQDKFFEIKKASINALKNMFSGDLIELLTISEKIEKEYKDSIKEFFEFWIVFFNEVMALKINPKSNIYFSDEKEFLETFSSRLTFSQIYEITSYINDIIFKKEKTNVSLKLLLEKNLLKIRKYLA